MSASEDEDYERSAKKLNSEEVKHSLCNLCNRKVVDSISCIKCNAILHKSCWNKSKKSQTATCAHVSNMEESSSRSVSTPITEINFENEFLRMQVKLLNELLVEVKSKNQVLIKNNELLIERIKFLESDNTVQKKRKQDSVNKPTLSLNIPRADSDKASVPSPSVSVTASTSTSNQNINNKNEDYENNEKENEQLWTTVVRKKNKEETRMSLVGKQYPSDNFKSKQRNMITCTGTPNMNAKVKGAIRKKWMYVGRIAGANVSEMDVLDYLADSKVGEKVEVKKLPTKGENSAFSIGVPDDITYDKLNSPDFWPTGVILREFNFRNFFRKKQELKER